MQSKDSPDYSAISRYNTYKLNLVLIGGIILGILLFASMLFQYFMLLHNRAFFLGFETYSFFVLTLLAAFALTLQLRIRSPIQPIPFKTAFTAAYVFCIVAGLTWALTSALYIRYIDRGFPGSMEGVVIRNLSRDDRIGAEFISIGYDPILQFIVKALFAALWGLIASLLVAAIDRAMPTRGRART